MNTLDVAILLFAGGAAYGGYRLGFVARAASWVGMAIGIFLAARLLPFIAGRLDGAPDGNVLLAAAGVLIAGAFLGQTAGLVVGARLHLALPAGSARQFDKITGAAVGALGVLVTVWLLLPVMSDIPEWPARQARTSAIAEVLADALPDPPDTLQALRQLIGEDQFPQVFDSLRPAPDVGVPPIETGLTEAAAEAVAVSTVKVEGVACSRIQDGTGAVIGPDLVVTNAHVVAGEDATEVERHPDRARLEATVVAFDPNRDLAILYVPGIDRAPLPIGDANPGDTGGVFGHPGGGPLRIAPYLVAEEVDANGTDIYDANRTSRRVLFLAAALMPGDSGSALVNPAGAVAGVAFAVAPDRPGVAYALDTAELHAVLDPLLASGQRAEVDTGPCLR